MKPFDLMKKLILFIHRVSINKSFFDHGESNHDLHYKKVFINFFLHGERNFQCSDTQTTDHGNNRTQWNEILSVEVLT